MLGQGTSARRPLMVRKAHFGANFPQTSRHRPPWGLLPAQALPGPPLSVGHIQCSCLQAKYPPPSCSCHSHWFPKASKALRDGCSTRVSPPPWWPPRRQRQQRQAQGPQQQHIQRRAAAPESVPMPRPTVRGRPPGWGDLELYCFGRGTAQVTLFFSFNGGII